MLLEGFDWELVFLEGEGTIGVVIVGICAIQDADMIPRF